jgi:hypothetical protein
LLEYHLLLDVGEWIMKACFTKLCVVLVGVSFLAACGDASFNRKSEKRSAGTVTQQNQGAVPCDPNQSGVKGQPNCVPVQTTNVPVQYPGQTPCTTPDCGKVPGVEPFPGSLPGQFPGQAPGQVPVQGCVKGGILCDNGGPFQIPGIDINNRPVDQGALQACMGAFRSRGVKSQGYWPVEVRDATSVNILGTGGFEDRSFGPKIIMVTGVNVGGLVGGGSVFRFLNPNALYCVNMVSVLDNVAVQSCYNNNVVFKSSVGVLSNVQNQIVPCGP